MRDGTPTERLVDRPSRRRWTGRFSPFRPAAAVAEADAKAPRPDRGFGWNALPFARQNRRRAPASDSAARDRQAEAARAASAARYATAFGTAA